MMLEKHHTATGMKPHSTLRRYLVHHKDKCEIGEQGELVYNIPWMILGPILHWHNWKAVPHQNRRTPKRCKQCPSPEMFIRSAWKIWENLQQVCNHWPNDRRKPHDKLTRSRCFRQRLSQEKNTCKGGIMGKEDRGVMNRTEWNYELSYIFDDVILSWRHHLHCRIHPGSLQMQSLLYLYSWNYNLLCNIPSRLDQQKPLQL